jgi:hypothetical protein
LLLEIGLQGFIKYIFWCFWEKKKGVEILVFGSKILDPNFLVNGTSSDHQKILEADETLSS